MSAPPCTAAQSDSPATARGSRVSVMARPASVPTVTKAPTAKPLPLLTLNDILGYQYDPSDEILPGGMATVGEPLAFIGAPGAGKTRLVTQLMVNTILGTPFLDIPTNAPGQKWLFLQTENSIRRLKSDLSAMTARLSADERAAIHDALRIVDIRATDFTGICMTEGHLDRERIAITLADFNPAMVVIDPLRDAGRGDLNTDVDMTAACQGISSIVRLGNPRRTPVVIHHGRTGACEASKVYGDDAASFGRNSKVLNGWLRSQINVAVAGVGHEGVIILGCGKNSNGPRWAPFAARLNEQTMTYERLAGGDFDLEQWAGDMAAASKKTGRRVTPEEVAEVVKKAGGEVRGGEKDTEGLVQRVRRQFDLSRDAAKDAVEASLGKTIQYTDRPGSGGRPARVYLLRPDLLPEASGQYSGQIGQKPGETFAQCPDGHVVSGHGAKAPGPVHSGNSHSNSPSGQKS